MQNLVQQTLSVKLKYETIIQKLLEDKNINGSVVSAIRAV
jgi:hypothetical protein